MACFPGLFANCGKLLCHDPGELRIHQSHIGPLFEAVFFCKLACVEAVRAGARDVPCNSGGVRHKDRRPLEDVSDVDLGDRRDLLGQFSSTARP